MRSPGEAGPAPSRPAGRRSRPTAIRTLRTNPSTSKKIAKIAPQDRGEHAPPDLRRRDGDPLAGLDRPRFSAVPKPPRRRRRHRAAFRFALALAPACPTSTDSPLGLAGTLVGRLGRLPDSPIRAPRFGFASAPLRRVLLAARPVQLLRLRLVLLPASSRAFDRSGCPRRFVPRLRSLRLALRRFVPRLRLRLVAGNPADPAGEPAAARRSAGGASCRRLALAVALRVLWRRRRPRRTRPSGAAAGRFGAAASDPPPPASRAVAPGSANARSSSRLPGPGQRGRFMEDTLSTRNRPEQGLESPLESL